MSLFEDLPALSPVQFFGISCDCNFSRSSIEPVKEFLLPSTADLLGEESFADVFVGWSLDKLCFYAIVRCPVSEEQEVDFRRSDSVELFLDTRDLKTKATTSRFGHHFVFFPVQVQNFWGREVTRFRGEDSHRLCHPEDLQVTPLLFEDSYHLSIEIPASCLCGYDPLSFNRLGFTYRVNRVGGASQHFAVSSEEIEIEHHPSTWGTLLLKGE